MTPDPELLDTFARTNSEDAFAELVRRHVSLVYSAALRQVGGDAHLAQDVAQTVFTDLARKATALARRESLTGWLYTSAHFAAAKIVRTETRRRDREEKFMREPTNDSGTGVSPVQSANEIEWETLRSALDAAMHELKEADREAILLRYFENRPFAEVGGKLGLNENAARMRVERALEKLRGVFAKRGVAVTASLAAVISANAVQVAPASLVAPIATTAIATAGAGTFTIMKLLAATKLKIGLAVLIVAGGATIFMLQRQAQEKLHGENSALSQQLAQMQTGNESLSNRLAALVDLQKLSEKQLNELMKLRGEVGLLKNKTAMLAKENEALKKQLKNRPDLNSGSETNLAAAGQLHVKARFISLPKNALAGFGGIFGSQAIESENFKGILNDENFRFVLKQFEKLEGVETLGEPEVVTTSGRQCQMRATEIVTVITNTAFIDTDDYGTETVETGPVLDVVPQVLPDGDTVTLAVTASYTDFLGYDKKTNITQFHTKSGKIVDLRGVSPLFDVSETTASVNLWDGQTLVLKMNRKSALAHTAPTENLSSEKVKTVEQVILVFVTADLVDPAGNKVHSRDEMSSKKDTVPSQPPPAFPSQIPAASN